MYRRQYAGQGIHIPRQYLDSLFVKHINRYRDRTEDNQDDQADAHRSRRHDKDFNRNMDPCQRRSRHTRSSHAFVVPSTLGARYRGQVRW